MSRPRPSRSRPLTTGSPGRPSATSSTGLGLALALALTSAAAAHDFWIEPATFSPAPVSTLRVGLRVGEAFTGQPVPRRADHLERFLIAGPAGARSVAGREGYDPAGLAPIGHRGSHLIGYESTGTSITLPAARFESYLEQEGLDEALRRRRERGEAREPGREVFVRSAKSLVRVGGEGEGFDRLLGLPLELVPESDPGALGRGDLGLRLYFRGAPAPRILVRARHRDRPEDEIALRTDAEGRVRLALVRPGPWLVTAVLMVEAEAGAEEDWRSFWASLTLFRPAHDEPMATTGRESAASLMPSTTPSSAEPR